MEILALPLPLPGGVALSKSPKLSEPQFPHPCSRTLLLAQGLGGEPPPTMVAEVPRMGRLQGARALIPWFSVCGTCSNSMWKKKMAMMHKNKS